MKSINKLLVIAIFVAITASTVLFAGQNAINKEDHMKEMHQKLGIELFNKSWELLLKPDRTPDDVAVLVNTVHASLWHWRQLEQPINVLRGEWMVCHVYTLLEHKEEALYHANNVMRLKEKINPTGWDPAYCYEAMARVMALHGNKNEFQRYYALALEAGEKIAEDGDRQQLDADLNDEYWFGMRDQP